MIYLDEGSSGFLVKDNLTETNMFFKNRNGEGNRWEEHRHGRSPGAEGDAWQRGRRRPGACFS